MVTAVQQNKPTRSEDEPTLIVSVKFSFSSNISSSVIEMLNVTNVFAAGKVTVCGPES